MMSEGSSALVGVIEDDEVSRSAMSRLLLAGGFEPAVFESAEAFIASPPRGLLCLIVDVHLTGMSGIALQGQLRAHGCTVPIIVTTGDRRDLIRDRAMQAGCAAFLWKPFSADALLSAVGSIARMSDS